MTTIQPKNQNHPTQKLPMNKRDGYLTTTNRDPNQPQGSLYVYIYIYIVCAINITKPNNAQSRSQTSKYLNKLPWIYSTSTFILPLDVTDIDTRYILIYRFLMGCWYFLWLVMGANSNCSNADFLSWCRSCFTSKWQMFASGELIPETKICRP